MKVLIFGATGMVGQGVLRECLLDPGVEVVRTVGRNATGARDPKLRETVHQDSWHYEALETVLAGFDACFFCLGVMSAGMKEADYEHITYGITMAAAETLCRQSGDDFHLCVRRRDRQQRERKSHVGTGEGQDGKRADATSVQRCDAFRPGAIQPLHGVRSRTPAYRALYLVFAPLMPLLRRMFPNYVLTTEQIGRAMLTVARHGAPKQVLETADINAIPVE